MYINTFQEQQQTKFLDSHKGMIKNKFGPNNLATTFLAISLCQLCENQGKKQSQVVQNLV